MNVDYVIVRVGSIGAEVAERLASARKLILVPEYKHSAWRDYLPHFSPIFEHTETFDPDRNESRYPLPRENEERYKMCFEKAKKLKDVYFVGWLGDYHYYGIDHAVTRALKSFIEVEG